ncbi:hypothetical protein GWK47_034521 [Chionoecetes opilio]|uniref:Uncharacterized protein n=1 Tax=Chionoecetes opilio TaxID=41210 RepID=A0A8J4YIV8_CHIOP|nr:hypothetical protein GWK47_034521 [Chionoecetes opilio]
MHASNHPRKTRQSVASHDPLSDVTACSYPASTLGKTLIALATPRKAASYGFTLCCFANADCPEPFKDILLPLLRTTLADQHTSTNMSPPLGRQCNPVTVPHSSNQTPQTKLSLYHFLFVRPTPDCWKGARHSALPPPWPCQRY